MSANYGAALAEHTANFQLPEIVDGADFSNDELADDMAGIQLNFQRVKIPSGGALQFELPGDDPENPDYAKTIDAVIIYNHAACVYWPEGSEYDEETTPLCVSNDGISGVGDPGGACATCPLNAYGSASNGKGKACKNMRVLFLLRDGEYMPIQLALPPTSLKPFSEFVNSAFVARRRGTCGSVVQIGLKRANNGKDDYSVATFKRLYDFSGEQLAQAKAYTDSFKAQIKSMLQQRTAEAMNRLDNASEAAPGYDELFGNDDGERFTIVGSDASIDGDREALPA